MDEPRYHLTGVVKSKDAYEDFTGPLDVILMLLSKNKIEIRDIQISLLLDQYLAWLQRQRELDLDVASEFVQMASHLTYIKTRMLLTADREEVTELSELVEQLERLQDRDTLAAVRQVAPLLAERSTEGLKLHVKEPMTLAVRREYHFSPEDLLRSMASILGRTQTEDPLDTQRLRAIPRPLVYGIKEKSEEILTLLQIRRKVALPELYALCGSRSELVATLLSLLELCHDGMMHLALQDKVWVACSGALSGEDYGTE